VIHQGRLSRENERDDPAGPSIPSVDIKLEVVTSVLTFRSANRLALTDFRCSHLCDGCPISLPGGQKLLPPVFEAAFWVEDRPGEKRPFGDCSLLYQQKRQEKNSGTRNIFFWNRDIKRALAASGHSLHGLDGPSCISKFQSISAM